MRWLSWLAISLCALLGGSYQVLAEDADDTTADLPPITFSKLILRIEGDDDIAAATGDYRVMFLETMRNEGMNTVGAENLVFARDDSSNADYVLGGTLREASCKRAGARIDCCRVGVEWELLDVASDEVVYRVMSRHGDCNLDGLDAKGLARHLLVNSLRRTLHRERFKAALKTRSTTRSDDAYASDRAHVARCKTTSIAMSTDANRALDATVLVTSGMSHGSGFFLTSSGLILTAAHVVSANKVTVRTHDGSSYDAYPLRISRKFDVALLRVEPQPKSSLACLPLAGGVATGNELYAIGAPADKELAFSLTRGIASGAREYHGAELVQTDAPVSPGNSGGPLVDNRGRVVAITSRKIVADAVEGVSFGVPITVALDALGLSTGDQTDAKLAQAPALKLTASAAQTFVDKQDPLPPLVRPSGMPAGPHNAIVEQGWDLGKTYRYFRGRFYLDTGLFMTAGVAPKYAPDRFVLTLNKSQQLPLREACKRVELVVNGRVYPAREVTELQAPVAVLHRGIMRQSGDGLGVEARFDATLLKRLNEHAPSVRLRTCDNDWALTPAQVAEFRKFQRAYDALVAEQ